MEVQKLHPDVVAKIRSSFTINTVTQCVIELVLNSLDAKATAIAVRINLVTFRIQVVDNGEGILEDNMSQVGRRYFTSKCKSIEQLQKRLKHYGFRGEALASIIEISKSVSIISRHTSSSKTNSKTWGKHTGNDVTQVRGRPSVGTTVTIEGFLYNLPIRRKRIINEIELEEIKRSMESLMIMNPNVSFTIRNDVTSELLLNTRKNDDIISAFKYLHPEVDDDFCFMKISKSKLAIDALLFKELSENKRLQYIFVNKRPICSPKIQKLVCSLFHKFHKVGKKRATDKVNKHPVFVMNIKCPKSQLDILLNPTKTMVEFENWDMVQRCIEKLVCSFFGNEIKSQNADKLPLPVENSKKEGGISEMGGAVRSYGYKRRNTENENKTPEKLTKLEDEDVIEETQLPPENVSRDAIVDSPCLEVTQRNKNITDHEALPMKDKRKRFSGRNSAVRKSGVEKIVISDIETCHISDTSSLFPKKWKGTKLKKPLPVKVFHKEKDTNKDSRVNILEKQNFVPLQDDAKSTLSKFTNDQNKGKSLIMNMFLKSTQIYSSDENLGEISASQETIYEEESNFLMENNFQTKVNGVSNAMSVSVNVKSTKKIRKSKNGEQKASKYVQTSLEENRMTSKGLQTTLSVHKERKKHAGAFPPDNIASDNYTIIFSDRGKATHFKFVAKNLDCTEAAAFGKFSIGKKCICDCHGNTSKYFDFEKGHSSYDGGFDFLKSNKFRKLDSDDQPIQQQVFKTGKYLKTSKYAKNETDRDFGRDIRVPGVIPKAQPYDNRSPYFATRENTKLHTLHSHPLDNFQIPKNYLDINFNPHYKPYFLPQYQYVMEPQYQFGMQPHQYGINTLQYGMEPHHRGMKPHQYDMETQQNGMEPHHHGTKPHQYGMEAHQDGIKQHQYGTEPHQYDMETQQHGMDPHQHGAKPHKYGMETHQGGMKQHQYGMESYQHGTKPHQYGIESQYQYGIKNDGITNQNLALPFYPGIQQSDADLRHCYSPQLPPARNDTISPRLIDYSHIQNENECYDQTLKTNDWTVGSFGQFKPVHLSTQQKENDKVQDKTDLIFSQSSEKNSNPDIEPIINFLSVSEEHRHNSPKMFCEELKILEKKSIETGKDETAKLSSQKSNPRIPSNSENCLCLNTQQKLEKDLEAERSLLAKEFLKWDSQFTETAREESFEDDKKHEISNDWIRKLNDFGASYYINKKTGFTSYYTPKPNGERFKLVERFELIPKGMSPILKEIKEVDKSLSQGGKDKLLEYIMETYKNELLYIKWQHYLKDVDPKTFFENMYKEKLKMFENCVPNITTRKNNLKDIVSFSKTLFQNIEVIGQVDKKFISVLDKENNLLVIFDQHAVHERIRLEKLLKIYKDAKSEPVEKMLFFIPENDLELLRKHESYLSFLGLAVEFFSNGINVVQVPMCLYSKFKDNNCSGTLNKMIHQLIKEITELLKSTRGVSILKLPTLLQNIINMEACRGSIKFGDALTRNKCRELLEKLSTCDLPFQCAHGRPTLTPLLVLDSNKKSLQPKVNFGNLVCKNK